MTTYLRDGERFETCGREFEAVEDRENHYQGFMCLSCGADFTHDPSDHECEPNDDANVCGLCGLCGMRRVVPPNTACGSCA